MPRTMYCAIGAILLATVAGQAASQAPPPSLHSGDRVRVWATDGPHIGVFDSLHAGLIVLRGQPPLSLAPSNRIDIAVGRRGHGLEGVGIGLLVGAGAGALVANGMAAGSGGMDIGAAVGAVVLGVGVWLGTTIAGGIVGSRMKSDRWRRVVPWPPSIDPSRPTAGSGGMAVPMVRIPFRILR